MVPPEKVSVPSVTSDVKVSVPLPVLYVICPLLECENCSDAPA